MAAQKDVFAELPLVRGVVEITLSIEAARELRRLLDFPVETNTDWLEDEKSGGTGMPEELDSLLTQLP